MKIVNLNFKEVKPSELKKELEYGKRYLCSSDCEYTAVHCYDKSFIVYSNDTWAKSKYTKGRWVFDNAGEAVSKFKTLCRVK